MVITLKEYLGQLQSRESVKPDGNRRHVPNLRELADSIGIHNVTVYEIANNRKKFLNLDTVSAVITELRRRGFDTTVNDLVLYVPPSPEVNGHDTENLDLELA